MKRSLPLVLILIASSLIMLNPSYPASSSRASEDSWISKAPLPSSILGVASANDKFYAFARNATYEYDPVQDVWATKQALPTRREQFGVAAVGVKIYVIGGWVKTDFYGVSTYSSANEVYNPHTDTWETKSSLPTPRGQLEANVVDGKIYLIGGRTDASNEVLNEVYDPLTDTWSTETPLPYPMSAYASAVVGKKIYIIDSPINQIYDTEKDTWSLGSPLPNVVRQAVGAATTGVKVPGRVYVFGGMPPTTALMGTNMTQIYNPEDDTWTVGAPMPTARFNLYASAWNDTIFVMGGSPYFNLNGLTCLENEQYTPSVNLPKTIPTVTPSSRPTPLATTVSATTDSGATVDLAISGNVTSSQMSNVTISTTQYPESATVSFTVTGESGTTGFSNMTVTKSLVPFGTTPTIYIDNQLAQDQGYTQDQNNYYVCYTTHFSIHEVSIIFTATAPSPTFTVQPSLPQETIYGTAATLAIVAIVAVSTSLIVHFKKRKSV